MRNAVLLDVAPCRYCVNRRFGGIYCLLVRFEVFTAMTMRNVVFLDVAPCRSCVNRRFGGTYHLHPQGIKIRERGTSL
jgi:hypothetical protein